MALRVAIDIGGGFADLLAVDEETGQMSWSKTRTTPDDLSRCVQEVLKLSGIVVGLILAGVNDKMGELYPTDVRGVGYSVGLTVQRISNSLAPLVIGFLLARNASFSLTVSFISAFLVGAVIFTLFLKETEGQVLH